MPGVCVCVGGWVCVCLCVCLHIVCVSLDVYVSVCVTEIAETPGSLQTLPPEVGPHMLQPCGHQCAQCVRM